MINSVCNTQFAVSLGLPINDNHAVFEWTNGDSSVYFSAAKRGDALSCHLAARRKDRVNLRKAVNEFCEWALNKFDVVKIVAHTRPGSVKNLCINCGFVELLTQEQLINDKIETICFMARFK